MKEWLVAVLFAGTCFAADVLELDVISYDAFIQNDKEAICLLRKALHEKGIVGIRGIPGYPETLQTFIQKSREFYSLPEEVKESYAPNPDLGEMFLGYEKGKEKFKRPNGQWVIDDLKNSFYAYIPAHEQNKWPVEVDLETAFQTLGVLMGETAKLVMGKIDLIGPKTGIELEDTPQVGRMLYYQKSADTNDNPYWCGAHYDHGLFTALAPATYFIGGVQVDEPEEAGLFVRVEDSFRKIVADTDLLLFQVGEFGQLVTNDAIRATEHRVHKAEGLQIERYAMALFFIPPKETLIHSTSELTQDARYGGGPGDPCTYQHWHEESFKRYLVKKEESNGN